MAYIGSGESDEAASSMSTPYFVLHVLSSLLLPDLHWSVQPTGTAPLLERVFPISPTIQHPTNRALP